MANDDEGYVESLRRLVGSVPVILCCAGCAVLDDLGRVLLQQRDEPGRPWGLPGGVMELGETPAEAAIRETREETGLEVMPSGLLGVYTGPPHTHPNGDVAQAVVVMLTATRLDGQLLVDGDETRALGWFHLDALPPEIFVPHQPILRDLQHGRRATWS